MLFFNNRLIYWLTCQISYTRYVQKESRIFIYLFINIYFVPFKVIPTRYYTLVPTFFLTPAALQKIIFCERVQLLLLCRLYQLNHSAASSFYGPIQFREQEKVTGVGCGITSVLFFAKNSRTRNDVWAGALSWCKSQFLFFHKSGRFWRIASRNLRITCR